MERVYTIPLRRVYEAPRTKRAPRAIRFVKEFIKRHMKAEDVIVDPEVNEKIWERGREKPPRRIRVRVVKYRDGTVKVSLAE
ncbi:MAG: 50S ribosomal protein L31e [Thermoprotei archaeon]|nr:MAG: 50S ribosomal protein L31e [Thermoprotei archaeon]RLF24607.1 MAG: 50S ribosomal protein L31e [Thermoprotei archaeon]